MKRVLSEPATSVRPLKKLSAFKPNNGFSLDTIPSHHFYLGENNFVVVSDFGDTVNVHIRKFNSRKNGQFFPTKDGVTFSPFVWESLSKEINSFPSPSETTQVKVICDTLFLASAFKDNVSCISLQRYDTKQDFSRQFLPSICLLSESEWNQLQSIHQKVAESCLTVMFGNFLKKKIISEVSSRSPRSNLEMDLSDIEMVLSMSLTEILADNLNHRIHDVFVCNGCIENQANQLAHECVTMNYESKHSQYGNLALFSIDIGLLAKDFVEKNIQMCNYINEAFLNKINVSLLLKSAYDMFIASDLMTNRMF